MKYIHYIIYITLTSFLFTSCQEEDFNSGAKGGIRISLTEDASVDVSTRSTPAELGTPLVAEFKIEVKNSAGNNKYSGKLPDNKEIPLDAGSYDVIAYYGTNETLALDSPYYEGSKEAVEVKDGYTTSVELTCKVANALLSIQINEDDKKKFDEAFKTPSFQLAVGGKSVATSDITKSFYFKAGSMISKLAFSKDGSDYQDLGIKNWPKEIKAADHIIVTVGIEPAPSGVSLKVDKVQVEEVTIEETIPMEWLPKPSVSATGFDSNNSLTFAETETKEAKLDLKLASALQDIKFKFDFQDEQFSLDKEKEYVWSNAEDKQVIESTLGISISDKIVDLNGLLAKLQTNAGTTTTNTIEVDVKANDRWSSEDEEVNRTYTITCNKPVFRVDAYPGNIWTKEFTMNALREEQVESGDFAKISGNIKYQYSTNQEQWSDLGSDLRQANLTAGTTYYIRGLYRDAVPSEVTEVKTYPVITLENGDMEDWAYEITNDARNPLTENLDYIYWKKWFPWNSVSTPSIWNTVNQTTTQDGNSPDVQWYPFVGTVSNPPYVGCCYVANSGTIPVEGNDAHNGKSALIKTVGWGSGNSAAGDLSDVKHVTPGELYLGTYELSSHQPIYGIEYNSRPTAVKFWYKYEPKSSDLMVAQIVLMNENGDTVGSASVPENEAGAANWKEKKLHITYTDIEENPVKMYILFKSGTSTDASVLEQPGFGNLSDGEYIGSRLYIDDVELVYDK